MMTTKRALAVLLVLFLAGTYLGVAQQKNANVQLVGAQQSDLTVQPQTFCDKMLTVSAFGTVSITQEVALAANQSVRVCNINYTESATFTVNTLLLTYGTGANCGTGTTTFAIIPTATAGANGFANPGSGGQGAWILPAGNAFCLSTGTATPTATVTVMYAQY